MRRLVENNVGAGAATLLAICAVLAYSLWGAYVLAEQRGAESAQGSTQQLAVK